MSSNVSEVDSRKKKTKGAFQILMDTNPFGSGFTPGARELFKQENHLALYQLPSGEKAKEFPSRHLHCFAKRQPPISHLISLFVRDSSSSESLPSPLCEFV